MEDRRRFIIDPRAFCQYWFTSIKKFKMLPNGNFAGNSPNIVNSLWLDYREFAIAESVAYGSRQKLLARNDLESAWFEFLEKEQFKVRAELTKSLSYTGNPDTELQNWLKAVVGNFSDFELNVMKHVIWLIKRKMNGLPCVYHIAPLFFGKQGGGKTLAIKALTTPLVNLTLDWGVDQAVDSKNTQTLSDNFLCIFDEMSGMQKVEMDALKRIITNEESTYRPLYTNRMIKVPQNCTFICISNKSVIENMHDATGMRRFVELKCLDKLDWNAINNINALKVFQSIDENKERGYLEPYIAQLGKHQEEMTIRDEMQQFLIENAIVAKNEKTKEITSSALYQCYIHWRTANGFSSSPSLSNTMFFRKLRTAGVSKNYKIIEGKERTVYLISQDSEVFKEETSKHIISQNLEWKQ